MSAANSGVVSKIGSSYKSFFEELTARNVPVFVVKPTGEKEKGQEWVWPKEWPASPTDAQCQTEFVDGKDGILVRTGDEFCAFDIDLSGRRADEALARFADADVPMVWVSRTPRGGYHVVVPRIDGPKYNTVNLTRGQIDFRGERGVLFVPGTSRPYYDGKGYSFYKTHDFSVLDADISQTELRARIDTALQGFHSLPAKVSKLLAEDVEVGMRSDQFHKIVGLMRANGFSVEQMVGALEPWCEEVKPEFSSRVESEVERCLSKMVDEAPFELVSGDDAAISSWGAVDLSRFLDADFEPVMTDIVPRSDGFNLLYSGQVHTFFGQGNSAKSFLAQKISKDFLASGKRVVYYDFETQASRVVQRLRSLGAAEDEIRENFIYICPGEALNAPGRAQIAALAASKVDLMIVDGVNDALKMVSGRTSDMASEFTEMKRALYKPFADAGSTVLVIDHITKEAIARKGAAAGAPLGSVAKFNAVDVAYRVEMSELRAAPGVVGFVNLFVTKDREGAIWEDVGGREAVVSRVRIDSSRPGEPTCISFETAVGAEDVRGEILRLLGDAEDGLRADAIKAAFKKRPKVVLDELGVLVGEGLVSAEKIGRGNLYRLIAGSEG